MSFSREDYKFRGVQMSRFTELPTNGSEEEPEYKLPEDRLPHSLYVNAPMVYIYSWKTGNMRMEHPSKYAKVQVMDRMPTRPKGCREGVPNDPIYAQSIAELHYQNYHQRRS